MASLRSPSLKGSPNSTTEHTCPALRSPSFDISSPPVDKHVEDPSGTSLSTQDPTSSSSINMNNGTSSTSGGSSYQGSVAPGGKKDDGVLDAFLPRIESRGPSRQAAPKKDDPKPQGQTQP